MATEDRWLAFADRLYAKGVDVFNTSDVTESPAGTKDPKVVALTLLARTLGNFQAAAQLLGSRHVVEARTLTRCCWENLFWTAALAKRGDEFVQAMELDDAASRMKRAGSLLKWTKKQDKAFDFEERLEKFYAGLKEKHGKLSTIKHERAAIDGGVSDGYEFYRELSGDAAHPSAVSLSRHVTWSESQSEASFTVHAMPVLDAGEVEGTFEVLCSAVLGVIVAASEVIDSVQAGESLAKLADDFAALSASNKALEEASE